MNPHQFLSQFQGNPSQHTTYSPFSNSYFTKHSAPDLASVEAHIAGEAILVIDPVHPATSDTNAARGCRWCCVDIDGPNHEGLTNEQFHKLQLDALDYDALTFRTKRLGAHVFVFFTRWMDFTKAYEYAKGLARALGYPDAETFPVKSGQYKAVALPKRSEIEGYYPVKCVSVSDATFAAMEAAIQTEYTGDGEPGFWTGVDLLANLTAWKKIKGFDFKKCRQGYAVPCPGNTKQGWPDGSQHSAFDNNLSPTSIVFLKNGLPCFHCFHAHCNELGKKTWKDYRDYWDKDRLVFSYSDWCDQQFELHQARVIAELYK